jgi:carboxyl-terminal processing protease
MTTTRKVIIAVSVVFIAVALTTGAFVGGVFVGRVTDGTGTPALDGPARSTPAETEAESDVPTPEPATPAAEMEDQASGEDPLNDNDDETDGEEAEASDPEASVDASEAFDYELLESVLDILDEQFYGEMPDGQTLAHGAIRGMLLTLDDPYTSFIEPKISEILNEDASGEFEGIGAMVTMRQDGYLEIASLIPDQPAQGAGVQAGDIIIAVNGESIVGLGLYEAISYIRGPAGTDAELEILREGEPDSIFITVTRARIEIPIIETEILESDIAYLRLTEFDAVATERVEEALEELLSEDPQALIFDLRGNPGGYLSQAIGVADLFLDQGIVAIQRDSQGGERVFRSRRGDIGEEIPLVVLIDGGSASASEIVAGAIQDRDRGVLVGTPTLGKGSVQLPNDLQDGSQLRVTIARWFTPDEQELHDSGLTPAIEVEYPRDTPEDEDPQLDRAIEYIKTGE